jgi:tetratricopeptide (TPR) repeat protein
MGEAAEEYTKILDSYPQETDALLYLSFCCIALNQKEEALNVLERLMAVNPSYLDCIGWRTYIRLQKETGRLQESLASLRDLARRHPRAEHQLLLAESLIEADEAIAARGILTTIIEYDAHAPAFSRRANRTFISRARRLLSDLA